MRVVVDARARFNYASYYILGLRKVAGDGNVVFKAEPFKELSYNNTRDYNSGLPIIIINDDNSSKKIFIDYEDNAVIFQDRYEWADIYGKINATKELLASYSKMLPIGPAFGIQLYGRIRTLWEWMRIMLKIHDKTDIPVKTYLRDYVYSFVRRRPLEMYTTPCEVRNNYIFHASTLWYNEFAGSDTNKYRGDFLLAAQRAGMEIEGGLFYLGEGPSILREMPDYAKYKDIYRDFIYDKRLSMDDYIRKTKESVVVFNTPSVCGCHGWKLAEYLCMGKAIISTPLSREMPGEGLVHGENIHYATTQDEIYEAIVKIRDDADYRHRLEQGARDYFDKWLSPETVVKRLVN